MAQQAGDAGAIIYDVPENNPPIKGPGDYAKISPTAILVAGLRARYTDLPYAHEIYRAVRLLTNNTLTMGTGAVSSRLARFAPYTMNRVAFIESRYLSVNQILKNLGSEYAVIEVAAGLSARGLEWAGSESLYIETDLPEMLSTKQKVFDRVLLETGLRQRRNHHFCPLNALDINDWDRIGRQFFGEGKTKIAVVHEGLASYLSLTEKEKLRDNIAAFLGKYASTGEWITPDFYPYENSQRTWLSRMIQNRLEQKTQVKMHHFGDAKEVLQFLSEGGFQASSRDYSFIMSEVSCIAKVPLDRETVRRALSRYRVYLAQYTGQRESRA